MILSCNRLSGLSSNCDGLQHLEDLSEDGWEQLRIGFVPLIHKMEVLPPVAHLKPGQLQIKPGMANQCA